MGPYAARVKLYKVEYGDTSGFNYDPDTLESIIREFCNDCYFGDAGNRNNSVSAIWEINKEEFEKMVIAIQSMPPKAFYERFGIHYSKEYI